MIIDPFYIILTLSTCFFTIICAILAIITSLWAVISVKSLENSTHKLEYVPIDPKWAASDKEIEDLNEQSELDFPGIDDHDELSDQDRLNLNKLI